MPIQGLLQAIACMRSRHFIIVLHNRVHKFLLEKFAELRLYILSSRDNLACLDQRACLHAV